MDDLRDVIIRIDERTKNMEDYAAKRDIVVDKRLDAHAGKIRALENWRYLVAGGFAVVVGWFKLSK